MGRIRTCIHCGKPIEDEEGVHVRTTEGFAWDKGEDLYIHAGCQEGYDAERVIEALLRFNAADGPAG